RRSNYALAPMDVDAFVAVVTDGLGEPPSYFAAEVALNRAGHEPLDTSLAPTALSPAEAVARGANGWLLLDLRDEREFAAGHLRGSVNVGLSGRFAEFAAAVAEPGQAIVLIGSAEETREGRMRLARVGLDAVSGAVNDLTPLVARPELLQTASRVTAALAADLLDAAADVQVVDVRGPGEHADGALPGAVNLPLPRLRTSLGGLDRHRPVLVHCAGGYRSSTAASVMRTRGFTDVSDLIGGYAAWSEHLAERPPARA
ncbi:MAG: rhodanese-like domain-containing protein, partial [Geodermatophilaceae bacterium]